MSPRFTVTVTRKQENVVHQNAEHHNEEIEEDSNLSIEDDNAVDDDDDVSAMSDGDDDDDDEIDIAELLEDDDNKKALKRKSSGQQQVDDGQTKKKKKKTAVSRAPPTVEEMTRLRETENLFHSNLFRLQIEELLREVKTKKKERRLARVWVDAFIKHLSNQVKVNAKRSPSKLKVKCPLPNLPDDAKEGEFQFEKPADVKVIGSFNSAVCLGPEFNIDVAVFMPKAIFEKEDYLNARYHKKRAKYLCHLAESLLGLESLDQDRPPHFCFLSSNPLKPVIKLYPASSCGPWTSRVAIFVHAFPESGTFKPARFTPEKNNVRPNWWEKQTTVTSEGELTPTPNYNFSIGRDVAIEANENLKKSVFEENQNLRDAILLLRVWLRQRQLDKGYGSFNGFILSMWLIYLFKLRKLNAHMSSYQVVRNTWVALAQTDWRTSAPSLFDVTNNSAASSTDYHSHYDIVFIDATGFVNLAADMSTLTYSRVKEEAISALKYLDSPSLNSFQALFMTKMPFLHQFDHILKIDSCEKATSNWSEEDKIVDAKKRLDHLVDSRALLLDVLTKYLTRGLGKRVDQIAIDCSVANLWPVTRKRPADLNQSIVIGLKLNPEHALFVLEKGPEANLPEAIEFRAFWGAKSELRRFQDGSICEAVAWDSPNASVRMRRLIARSIVSFIVADKLMIPKNTFTYVADQLECVLPDATSDAVDLTTAQVRAVSSLDGLSRLMLDIDDLPLTIAAVQGVSPALRFCHVFPPMPHHHHHPHQQPGILDDMFKRAPPSMEPIDAVIQLGLSKKWPDDVAAIRRIKAAFFIELASKLLNRHKLKASVFPDCLIVFKDDYAFRLRLVCQHEIARMKETVGEGGVTSYKDNAQSLAMERDLVHLPLINSVLYGLAKQCAGFGPAAILTKRWLRAQMVDDVLFPDVAVELLVASLFVSAAPYARALQPQAAFLRALQLLAATNWCVQPLILNFNDQLTRDEISEIEEVFRTGREIGSLPPLFIATNYDKSGSAFTRSAPILPVLYHVSKVAKASLDVLEKQLMSNATQADLDYKVVFRPPLDIFDCVININPAMNASRWQNVDEININRKQFDKHHQEKNSTSDSDSLPLIDFNPIQCYLQELRRHYDDFALFFHDTFGGNTIGVLFKPTALHKRDFKVSHLSARKPVLEDGKPKLVLNKEAILEDFKAIGKGVVLKIEINNKK